MADLVVAVTGAAGFVGQRFVSKLATHPEIARVVGLDVREPTVRAESCDYHRVDIASRDLRSLFDGVDVVVHLAGFVDAITDDALMASVNVDGTRRVLDAVAVAGVGKLIRVSTTTVYGAWETNSVPLTEDAQLRPNSGYAPAVQSAEVERVLQEWQQQYPEVVVTTLRSAPVLGPGAEHLWARLLSYPTRVRVSGEVAPVQVVHVDDLVSALELVVGKDAWGVFNVATDGWLSREVVDALVPMPTMPRLPVGVLRRALDRMWGTGMGDVPPDVVPYLIHPWVVANDRMRALGWQPMHSTETTILDTVDARPPSNAPSLRTVMFSFGAASVAVAVGVMYRTMRRRLANRNH